MQRSRRAHEQLEWNDVRLFLALFRAPTVGRAARSLRVDASTVSRRLALLERALSITLFDRGRDGIAPTKAAEDLLPVAEEMEEVMARFSNAADGLEREVTGSVRVTCPPDVAEVLLTPLLPDLLARHPKLRIDIDTSSSVLDLTRREADLALRTARPERGDLVVTRLLNLRWVLVAAPKLARALGTVKALGDAPWVSWGERSAHISAARWFAAHVRGVEPLVRSDSLLLQLAVVASGVGVALVPEPSVVHYGLTPLKLAPSLRGELDSWPLDALFLVTHRALRDVPRVRALWDLLVQRAGQSNLRARSE